MLLKLKIINYKWTDNIEHLCIIYVTSKLVYTFHKYTMIWWLKWTFWRHQMNRHEKVLIQTVQISTHGTQSQMLIEVQPTVYWHVKLWTVNIYLILLDNVPRTSHLVYFIYKYRFFSFLIWFWIYDVIQKKFYL